MERDRFLKHLEDTFEECLETAKKKNSDYAGDVDPFANFCLVEKLGICSVETGILVRLTDKFARIINLTGGREAKVKDEAVEDTLKDVINYCAILLAYKEAKNE